MILDKLEFDLKLHFKNINTYIDGGTEFFNT